MCRPANGAQRYLRVETDEATFVRDRQSQKVQVRDLAVTVHAAVVQT